MAEPSKEQTDRQLIELLNELRVALPGAQVLLGFLLTVPFATRFETTSQFDRAVLFACTLFTTVGVCLLMAPSVYHRMRWNRGGKQDVIQVGHRLFLAGSTCLAAGLVCAVFVVGDVLYGIAAAVASTIFIGVVIAWTWYALPVQRGNDPAIRSQE